MQTNRTYSIIFFYWGGDVCTRVCVENVITRLINFAFVLLNFFVFWCLYIPLRDFCNSEQPTENKNNITQRETVSCCCCCVVSSDSNTIHFLVSQSQYTRLAVSLSFIYASAEQCVYLTFNAILKCMQCNTTCHSVLVWCICIHIKCTVMHTFAMAYKHSRTLRTSHPPTLVRVMCFLHGLDMCMCFLLRAYLYLCVQIH